MSDFKSLLETRWAAGKVVCLGLDPDPQKIATALGYVSVSIYQIVTYLEDIIHETNDLVAAYKPNTAFFERFGAEGIAALKEVISHIQKVSNVPVICDAKRADIGNTNKSSAAFVFDYLAADAITVNPYFGREALSDFLGRKEKGVIVLVRTSNPGSNEFQRLHTTKLDPRARPEGVSAEEWLKQICDDNMELYERVAFNVAHEWNQNSNCLVVAGATYPTELGTVRRLVNKMPILIPGIGTQGGDVDATVINGIGPANNIVLINSSSALLYTSHGRDYAKASRKATQELQESIFASLKKQLKEEGMAV